MKTILMIILILCCMPLLLLTPWSILVIIGIAFLFLSEKDKKNEPN